MEHPSQMVFAPVLTIPLEVENERRFNRLAAEYNLHTTQLGRKILLEWLDRHTKDEQGAHNATE